MRKVTEAAPSPSVVALPSVEPSSHVTVTVVFGANSAIAAVIQPLYPLDTRESVIAGGGVTAKPCVVPVAARWLSPSAMLACSSHVPSVTNATSLPVTVQMAVVSDVTDVAPLPSAS